MRPPLKNRLSGLTPLSNQYGSGLIVILIAVGVLAFVALGVMTTRSQSFREIQRVNLHLSATNLKSNMMTHFNNAAAWTNTKTDSNNSTMSCLRPVVGSCSAGPTEVRVLRDAAGTVLFDASVPTKGFKPSGEPCDDFVSSGTGNPNCPFRPEISWDPVCQTGSASCVPSVVAISVKLKVNDGSNAALNMAPYNFVLNRAP